MAKPACFFYVFLTKLINQLPILVELQRLHEIVEITSQFSFQSDGSEINIFWSATDDTFVC